MKPLIEIKYDESSKKDLFVVLNIIIFILCFSIFTSIIIDFNTEFWFVFILSFVGILMSVSRIKNISKIKKILIYPDEIIVNNYHTYKKEDIDFIYIKPIKYGFTHIGIFILKKKKKPFLRMFPIATIYFEFIGGQLIYTNHSSIEDYFQDKKIKSQITEKETIIKAEQSSRKSFIIILLILIISFILLINFTDEKINIDTKTTKPLNLGINKSNYIIDINMTNQDILIVDYPFY